MARRFFALTAAAVLCSAQATAGTVSPPPTTTVTGISRTTAFVGLNWVFSANGQSVEGILGVAHGNVDASGDVTGAKGALHFGLNDGIELRKLKLTGLVGDNDIQAEGGLGFNLANGSLFGIGGLNGDYFHAGGDLHFNGLFEGYAGVHSIGDFGSPIVTTIVPPPAFGAD